MKILAVVIVLFGLLFGACERGEIPVDPREPGDVEEGQLEMEADYRYRIFFDLETNSEVYRHLKTDWDLGFACGSDDWRIVLNTSRGMGTANLGAIDFGTAVDVNSAQWNWDVPSGHQDSTAIGDWRDTDNIYLIDRGYTPDGTHMGYRKIQIISVSETEYEVRSAQPTEASGVITIIPKDNEYNYYGLSLTDDPTTLTIEPLKDDWDLVFTQYTNLFPGPLAYLVTGVLINPNGVETAHFESDDFASINRSMIENYDFIPDWDGIGYDWKFFDLDAGLFTIFPEDIYLIKSVEGTYFKWHFLDFYTTGGVKGAPRFEFQQL